MRSHLVIVILSPGKDQDQKIISVLEEWNEADIATTFATVSRDLIESDPVGVFYENESKTSGGLYELLANRVWTNISIVSIRTSAGGVLEAGDEQFESQLLDTINKSFKANKEITIRIMTVSIADPQTPVNSVRFSPRYDAHLVLEDSILADSKVAAVPVTDAQRPLVLALTALLAGGGFIWQTSPVVTRRDVSEGQLVPVRVVRSMLRVVNGGHLTDDIVIGAFPVSGPWSVPPEMQQVRAAPLGVPVPHVVSDSLAQSAGFYFDVWKSPPQPRAKEIGLLEGLKLFFKNFFKIVADLPGRMVERGKEWAGSKAADIMQRMTFGDNSAYKLAYRPGTSQDDFNTLQELQRAGFGEAVFPMADSRPWDLLVSSSFGLVDGGKMPAGIDSPQEGSKRLVYIDPKVIGPSPSDLPFILNSVESAVLGLPESGYEVGSLDVAGATSLDGLLAAYRGSGTQQADVESLKRVGTSKNLDQDKTSIEDDFSDPERHRPTHPKFRQSEYSPLAVFYSGTNQTSIEKFEDGTRIWKAALDEHQTVDGPFIRNGRCDHCGTTFLLGVVYRHEPSGKLLHLGNVCARKIYPRLTVGDETRQIVDELERRWIEWKGHRENTYLWRAGRHIEDGISKAKRSLTQSIEIAAEPDPDLAELEAPVRSKMKKARLFAAISLLTGLVVGVALSVVFAIISLIYCIIAFGGIVVGWILRLARLTRDLAAVQFKLNQKDSARLLAMQRANHDSKEFARLLSFRTQFSDWQAVTREIVHAPFGRSLNEGEREDKLNTISRPQSFLLGQARPSADQLTQAQLKAKSVTIHQGWLSEVFDTAVAKWEDRYRRFRLAGDAEDLSPAMDNSDPESLAGSYGKNDEMYYPRSDFRRRLAAGGIREAAINDRIGQILESLAEQPLSSLLSDVVISGPGAALSGVSPDELLDGLKEKPVPQFSADLFGIDQLELRIENHEFSTIGPTESADFMTSQTIGSGSVFTAASWRMDFSKPVHPSLLMRAVTQKVVSPKTDETEPPKESVV